MESHEYSVKEKTSVLLEVEQQSRCVSGAGGGNKSSTTRPPSGITFSDPPVSILQKYTRRVPGYIEET